MRKRTLGVVLLAGLAISGSGAFTAANEMSAVEDTDANAAGYGDATVSGGTVLSINYTHDSSDSTVSGASFVADGDWTSLSGAGDPQGTISFYSDAAGTALVQAWECTPGTLVTTFGADLSTTLFNCALPVNTTGPTVAEVVTTGITLTR